jgi:hypothetical protein
MGSIFLMNVESLVTELNRYATKHRLRMRANVRGPEHVALSFIPSIGPTSADFTRATSTSGGLGTDGTKDNAAHGKDWGYWIIIPSTGYIEANMGGPWKLGEAISIDVNYLIPPTGRFAARLPTVSKEAEVLDLLKKTGSKLLE